MSSQRPTEQRGDAGLRLPPVGTSFVGRDTEIAVGQELLARPDVRVLTLTGPGGVGKTRLALALADQVRGAFRDGVIFVPLAPIRDPALVVPTIAQRLGLPDQASRRSHAGLPMFLRERQILLILDNFEQVADSAADLDRLLDACPELKLIVTSTRSLRINGQQELEVPPLSLPEIGTADRQTLMRSDAIHLFIDRATSTVPTIEIGDADLPLLTTICRRAGGLPLAIELVAAACHTTHLAEIAEQLAKQSSSNGGGESDGRLPQTTMRDTIMWTHDRLNPRQQLLFRRLAVFNGGFSPESAGALCDALGMDASAVIEPLIAGTLIQRVARPGEPERWRLLETIRAFALELLASSSESDAAHRWHAEYFAALSGEAEDQLVGSEQAAWLRTLEREHDNLRSAISWSIEHREVDLCLTLAAGAWRFWERRGHVGEGGAILEQIIALAVGSEPSPAYISTLFGLGRLRYVQGEFELARESFRTLAEISTSIESDRWLSAAYTQLSHLATREGDYLEARELSEAGLSLRRRSGDVWAVGISLLVLGRNAHYLGDDDRATQLIEESIDIFRQLGDPQGMADGYDELGEFALHRGKYALARGHIEQALAYHQELGDDLAVADSLALLGYVAIGQRNYVGARSLFTRSLTRLIDLGARWRLDPALEGLAEIALNTGDPERAVRIMAAADRIRSEMGTLLDPNARERDDRNRATARLAIGDDRFDAAWQAGGAYSIDRVSAEALVVGQAEQPPG